MKDDTGYHFRHAFAHLASALAVVLRCRAYGSSASAKERRLDADAADDLDAYAEDISETCWRARHGITRAEYQAECAAQKAARGDG